MYGEWGRLVLGYHWGLLWGSVLYRSVVSLGIPGKSVGSVLLCGARVLFWVPWFLGKKIRVLGFKTKEGLVLLVG